MALDYTPFEAVGDGIEKNFTFGFPFIISTDVKVLIDGVLQALTTDYLFNAAQTVVEFVAAPASGEQILIRRETKKDAKIVDYSAGANVSDGNLDIGSDQSIYNRQEHEYDALPQRIVNAVEDDGFFIAATYVAISFVSGGLPIELLRANGALEFFLSLDILAGSAVQHLKMFVGPLGTVGDPSVLDVTGVVTVDGHFVFQVTDFTFTPAVDDKLTIGALAESGTNDTVFGSDSAGAFERASLLILKVV